MKRSLLAVLVAGGFSLTLSRFTVHTPGAPVTAVYGQYTVLSCSFPAPDESSLDKLVVSWQCVETGDVVHRYFSGKEQLSHQSPRYSGRTSLFPEELKRGNVSVKLDRVRPEDAGQYVCFVRNTKGSGEGFVSLIFAAYYREPDFFIELTPSRTVFRFESQGYPEATVSWYNEENEDISTLSETTHQQSGDGLYSLQSILQINDTNRSSNYTFRLRNDVLHQSVSRTFGLSIEMKTDHVPEMKTDHVLTRNRWMLAVTLAAIAFIIFILAIAVCKNRASLANGENQNEDGIT